MPVPDELQLLREQMRAQGAMMSERMQTVKLLMDPKLTEGRAAKPRAREPLNRQRGVDQVSTFEGSFETYDAWRTEVLAFIGEDDGIKKLLEWAEGQSEDTLT